MASSNSVKILEITRVSPSSDSSNSITEFTLPLTFLDTYWLKFPPNERVIFYQLTEPTHEFFNSVILPKLKSSLSLTLFHYLPLAGSLKWDSRNPKPIILYRAPNDAVSFTVVVSTADLNRLSSNGTREAIELHPLVPELSISDNKASIISLQITFFPGQGFCIGITSNHAVVDGQTLTMFIKAWAYICKQEKEEHLSLPQELIPFFDRSVIKDPVIGLDMMLLNLWLGSDSEDPNKRNLKLLPALGVDPNSVRATFNLTREDFKKLREKIQNDVAKPELKLSTFVLAYAYVFVCMVKARGGDNNKSIYFVFSADYRSRLDPPIPSNYFGNCVMGQTNFAKAGDFMQENGVVVAAEKISDMVLGLDMELLERSHESLSELKSLKPRTVQVVSVAGSTRFGVYGLDLRWGRPIKTEIVSIDRTGAISMSDCRDGNGGVEVGLSLSRNEMEIFSSLFVDGLKNL